MGWLSFVSMTVLYAAGRIYAVQLAANLLDAVLGVLFVIAFVKTGAGRSTHEMNSSRPYFSPRPCFSPHPCLSPGPDRCRCSFGARLRCRSTIENPFQRRIRLLQVIAMFLQFSLTCA